ncbi:tyrosine-protein phosphatase [Paraferrimonas haliotis]|uniref:protein-tyrosine-phosphatase n=1 Tax=Paraferrimonas haliotis TaxID=2013866 RepID=A0AA37TPM0_9GAMM|nr:CpsB/CapC family capsule biosynthesis tyrosine phosphatase [Paraferrimonas haliotis]GLS84598.1 tyrosine protein phosphatase [Paraferrimonas haliotis]
MIDIHCHLLPGIDDGPDDLETALAMASMALEDGIQHSIVTPHITPGRFENQPHQIAQAFMQFRQHLLKAELNLSTSFAAELRVDPTVLTLASSNRLPTLGTLNGQQIILLEMPHTNVPVGIEKLIRWLLQRDIRPIIAHPERNRDVWQSPQKLSPLVQLGCYFQITAGSLLGAFRRESYDRAIELLQQGLVSSIATDAHNLTTRPPKLSQAVKKAANVVGEAKAKAMVIDFPQSLLSSARDGQL